MGIISVVAFSFMVHEPRGIMLCARDRSLFSRRFRYLRSVRVREQVGACMGHHTRQGRGPGCRRWQPHAACRRPSMHPASTPCVRRCLQHARQWAGRGPPRLALGWKPATLAARRKAGHLTDRCQSTLPCPYSPGRVSTDQAWSLEPRHASWRGAARFASPGSPSPPLLT